MPINWGSIILTLAAVTFFICIFIYSFAAWWNIFTKAGRPGWQSLVPFYNFMVMLEIAGKPWWWIIFLLIPILNIFINFRFSIALAKAFGKSTLFGFFLIFWFPIGYLILGFDKSQYKGIK